MSFDGTGEVIVALHINTISRWAARGSALVHIGVHFSISQSRVQMQRYAWQDYGDLEYFDGIFWCYERVHTTKVARALKDLATPAIMESTS